MIISFKREILNIDGLAIKMSWPIRDAKALKDKVVVLFDPNSYVLDPEEKARTRSGGPSLRNLVAVSLTGQLLWEAEFPDRVDYYYLMSSVDPLVVNSFSSYKCDIDSNSGAIKSKEFLK